MGGIPVYGPHPRARCNTEQGDPCIISHPTPEVAASLQGRTRQALVFAGPAVTAEAGSRVSLPCNLTGPELSWRWVPRYPRCAGGSGGIQTIYTVTAAQEHDAPEQRFQKRLRLLTSQGNRTSVLELRPLHMNDSGAFFCASPRQDAPPISVTVTPGCLAGASIEMIPQEPVVEGASVSLSCSPCGAQGPTSPPAGGATWRLNGKLPPDPTALRILRSNMVTIEGFSSSFEGLWSCHLPGDPPRSGGYCLERDPGTPGTQESPPPGPTPTSPGRNHSALEFAGREVTADAGSTVNLSCTLTGPRLSWRWVPRYPRCAGGSSGIQTIYTVTAAGAHDAPEGRFQKRLRLLMDQGTRTSVLELRPLHMNDSGAFFCASPRQDAPSISVTVTPGCPAGASITAVPQEPVREGAFLSLSCTPCGVQGPTSPHAGGGTWQLNGKPLPDSTGLRKLRSNMVTIEGFSSRWEGLWSCRLPGDPPRSGGYCLERDPGAHGTQESPPPGPTSPGPSPTSLPLLPLVGGCVGAALGLVLVGIVAVICRRRRRARAASATPRVTEMDRKSERAAEQPGPPAPAGAEQKPPSPDPHPDGEGPEGISYSTVHFQAPRGAGARAETGPATIYSELATGHG